MNILFIGDIVGKPGRTAVREAIRELQETEDIDLFIANGENSAGGSGITPKIAAELFESGVSVITSGDHIWRKKEVLELFASTDKVLRPANYPPNSPGKGSCVVTSASGISVGVINILGRVFMQPADCPFRAVESHVIALRRITPIILVDFHAEATSEKIAMGWFLDGKVSAVVGTHTHIPTADAKLLPKHTAYITDVGMVGSEQSVLGRDIKPVVEHFVTGLPTQFTIASDNIVLQSVLINIDDKTGHATGITRMEKKLCQAN
ncbi:TIGR00282 family metallophosphoesterase [bacterium]|nr:TIGR00282 family metallophosphoesterase [bacterium]